MACQNDTDSIVRIEFERVTNIPDSAWIKIDDITFIHTPHDIEWRTEKVFPQEEGEGYFAYVPTSVVFHYHPTNQEKRVMEKMTNFEVIGRMGKTLMKSKQAKEFEFQIVNPTEYLAAGILKLQRTDKKKIEVTASEDNPVSIRYMSQIKD